MKHFKDVQTEEILFEKNTFEILHYDMLFSLLSLTRHMKIYLGQESDT